MTSKTSVAGMRGQVVYGIVFFLAMATTGTLGFFAAPGVVKPQEREFTVLATNYAYEPAVIRVNKGDTVRLHFASGDVVHGFYLEGHDIDVKIYPMRATVELHQSGASSPEITEEVVFTADQEGKFRYRCSQTCGYLHPFMLGELIVEPNRLLPTSLGLALGVLLGGALVVRLKERKR